MTNYEIKSRIAIMQVYRNGKQIQEYVDGKWVNVDEPEWKDSSAYRIKPETRYRPFDNADECWNEMMKHQPFGIVKDKYYTNYQCKRAFTYLTMKGCNFRGYEDMTFESCFKNLIFDDGKPFGIRISESLMIDYDRRLKFHFKTFTHKTFKYLNTMGTNFYCREKISKKSRTQIRSLLDDLSKRIENADESADIANMYDSCKESIEEYIPEEIHLGKRSYGWQFLWDYHNGKYYEANLESIKKYLSDKIIYDEYGEIFTIDQFFDDEIKYCLYNKDGKLEDGMKSYPFYYFKSDDGLRFSIHEDFS